MLDSYTIVGLDIINVIFSKLNIPLYYSNILFHKEN